MAIDTLVKNLSNSVKDRKFKTGLCKDIIDIIFKRTKAGKGVNDDGAMSPKIVKLKRLSDSYKKHRRRNRGQLDPSATANRSNLTFTGQMLRAFRCRITSRGLIVQISKSIRKDGEANDIVAFFASFDRPFLALAVSEQRRVVKMIDTHIERTIKRSITKTIKL